MRPSSMLSVLRFTFVIAAMLATLDASALTLTGVVSRKVHAGVVGNADRALDRNAPIDGAVTVEPRAINSGHSIIFQFDETVSSVVGASVIDANGAPAGNATAVPSGSTVNVTLSNVTDPRRVTIRVNGVNGAFNTEVSLGFLLGDTDNSYSVNATDSTAIKARSGQTVSVAADNYKLDVNGSGRINAADIVAVKSRNGRSLVAAPANTLTDVYVAGYENNGTSDIAKVWKNGIATALTDGTNNAEATAVHVSGADVYVAGREYNGTRFVAKVWKNGTATSLTNGTFNARVVSIFVSGADVYVAGFEGSATNNVAKIWKNAVATSLSGGTNDANAYSVFVSGGDVYVAGYEFNGTYNVAKVWKNAVATDISNGTRQIDLRSVYVSGADVYVAGSEHNGNTFEAKVWKNGVATNLTAPASDGNASSVFVSGADVYVAGSEIVGGTRVAKVWKNAAATVLSSGTNHFDATSVFVSGADAYVAGYEQNGVTFSSAAKVWKNGATTNLSALATPAIAYSVFAVASNTPAYTVGGTLSGLGVGKTVVLRNNGGNDLSLNANGAFTFITALASSATYSASVLAQPAGQICTVANANGTVGNSNVNDINVSCANLPPDTIAPVVSLTAPTPGTTVSGGAVIIRATATDNVGVVGVQFKLDGVNLQAEATNSPYSISWDTNSATNGTHTLTATARDAAGNSTNATDITVTVANFALSPIWIGEFETAWDNTTSPKTTASLNVQAGDVLVAYAMSEADTVVVGITGGALTWTQQQAVVAPAFGWAGIWTATAPADAAMTVTFAAAGGTGRFGGNVVQFRNAAIGASANTFLADGAPTLNLTTTAANSAIVVANVDWNGNNAAPRVWRTNAGVFTELTYHRDTCCYAAYGGYHENAGAIGTYAVGLAAPAAQKYAIAAIEIKGSPPPITYSVGGTLTGLDAGKSLVLRNNGGNDLSLNANGAFTFTTTLLSATAYAVTVLTHPSGQACYVANGSGTIGSASVSNVSINCGVAGASGSLDVTFGNGGFVVHGNAAGGNAADVGQSIAIDATGRIVVSGYSTDSTGHSNIAVWRYNANGTLDTTFNGTGVVTELGISWNGAAINEGVGVAIDSLGRIVVAGYTLTDINTGMWMTVVWRYNPDGTRDTSFNGVGVANFPFGQMQSIGYSVAVDASDRIVVGGIAWNGTSWDATVSRNIVSGDLDTTFNAVGYAIHNGAAGGNGEDVAQGITIDGSGRILLTGGSVNANGASDMTLWRYNADGTLDTTFNGTGYFTYVNPNGGTSERNSVGSTISIDSVGRIVVTGRNVPIPNSLDGDLAIWRFNDNGTLDTSFNGTGIVTHNGAAGGNGHDDGYAGVIDSTGRIYATGLSLNALGNYDMVVWRFNANGTLDTSFNGTGLAVYAGTAGGTNATDAGRSIKIDSSNRIVVTGSSRNAANNSDMVIWRINP